MTRATPRQLDVLSAIRDYRHRTGCPPRLCDIGEALGINKVTVLFHVRDLEQLGMIRREPYKARSIEVITDVGRRERMPLRFPVIGVISRFGK